MDLTNKNVCVTGRLQYGTRDIVHRVLTEHGANIHTTVTNRTDILICGKNVGSKYAKAIRLGIETWTENKLMEVFGQEINILILDIEI